MAHALNLVLWRQMQLDLLSLRPSWSIESSRTARANYTERPHLKNPPDTPMGRMPGLLFPWVFATVPFPIAHTLLHTKKLSCWSPDPTVTPQSALGRVDSICT